VTDTKISHVLDEQQKQRQVAATPLGRLARPGDVAQVVGFYASEDNAFMTGTTAGGVPWVALAVPAAVTAPEFYRTAP
jgi:NAD(P)-dependent dehydrogenase (short-subunit alcohol dehydrogenase family)